MVGSLRKMPERSPGGSDAGKLRQERRRPAAFAPCPQRCTGPV